MVRQRLLLPGSDGRPAQGLCARGTNEAELGVDRARNATAATRLRGLDAGNPSGELGARLGMTHSRYMYPMSLRIPSGQRNNIHQTVAVHSNLIHRHPIDQRIVYHHHRKIPNNRRLLTALH